MSWIDLAELTTVGRTGLGPPKNTPAGRSRRCGPHRPTDWKNGRADRPRSAEECPCGRSRRCGPHRPTDWENGRADRLGPPKNAPAGRSRRCGPHRPTDWENGRADRLGPPKNPLREKSALRAASPYLCEAFQHSMKPDAKSSGRVLIHASSTGIGSHIADSISAAGNRMLPWCS